MATLPQSSPQDEKIDLDHVERVGTNDRDDPVKVVTEHSADVSKYAHLTFGQTLRQFWRAMAISFGCGILAMGDGYQYKMPGNIVALEGFIRQMGYQLPDGKWKLDPNHVAAWGGEYSLDVEEGSILMMQEYMPER